MTDDEHHGRRDDQRSTGERDEDRKRPVPETGKPETTPSSDSDQAQKEQDRQVESGEENPT